MNKKLVKLGKESRLELLKGIEVLSKSVVCTLGPNGRNVVISKKDHPIISTKDGVTVAKEISLKDPFQNQGVELIKQASLKTAEKAGDGTTTATSLAYDMIKRGIDYINTEDNAVQVKRQMEAATSTVIESLKLISRETTSKEQLEQIATISANNDKGIGKIISMALDKAGMDGLVHIEKSKTGETYLEEVEGVQFNQGYKSPYFVKNNETMSCMLNNPSILLCANRIQNVNDIIGILQLVSEKNKPLLIIANDISGEALATLLVNKSKGILDVVAVKSPEHGDRNKIALEDIAILTGGKVFDSEKGMKWKDFEESWLGESRICTVTKDQTTIVDVKGDPELIKERISEIKAQFDKNPTPYEKQFLQSRLSKMSGGVEIVYIGGFNEVEIGEKTDRADDALHATKAAREMGILPGGGVALLHARKVLDPSKDMGTKIIYEACAAPFNQILENAGLSNKFTFEDQNNPWIGYDINSLVDKDMNLLGVIDPTKVTITALENATSVAGTVLITESTIVDDEEGKNNLSVMETLMNQGML